MRLWQKIFLSSLSLIIVAINVVSVMLLNNSHKMQLEREQTHAVNEYEYLTASVTNAVIYERLKQNKILLTPEETVDIIIDMAGERIAESNGTAIYNSSGKQVWSDNRDELSDNEEYQAYLDMIESDESIYRIKVFNVSGRYYLIVGSVMTIEGECYKFVTSSDITEIYLLKQKQTEFIRRISIACAGVISLILLASIILLLRPLNRMNMYTKDIANGNYSVRIKSGGSVELRELAVNMNIMADSIENNAMRLEKIAEDRQTFIANLAHEMKTPLTSILGFADLLKIKRNVSDRERFDYARTIVEETKRLRSLSGKLMEIITICGTEIEKKPVSLKKLIEDAGAALTPLINNSRVELVWSVENIIINADDELFKSLLYNLIENAIKASAIGQRIELDAEMRNGKTVISIKDYGIGMKQEDIERVFEPFYMVDKSRSRKAGGAGLGLALCAEIAKLHDAVLKINSSPGKGTTIYIIISGGEYGEV